MFLHVIRKSSLHHYYIHSILVRELKTCSVGSLTLQSARKILSPVYRIPKTYTEEKGSAVKTWKQERAPSFLHTIRLTTCIKSIMTFEYILLYGLYLCCLCATSMLQSISTKAQIVPEFYTNEIEAIHRSRGSSRLCMHRISHGLISKNRVYIRIARCRTLIPGSKHHYSFPKLWASLAVPNHIGFLRLAGTAWELVRGNIVVEMRTRIHSLTRLCRWMRQLHQVYVMSMFPCLCYL